MRPWSGRGGMGPHARPFRTAVAGSGGSLGFGPGAALQEPWPTPTWMFGPAPTVGPEARPAVAILLI